MAGIATGLVGLSAATIVAPLFSTMLGMPVYPAIGIALGSDVFASATSSATFIKHKNVNLRNKQALVLGVTVVSFAIVGSFLSQYMKPFTLKSSINIFVFVLGIRFLVYPVKNRAQDKVIKRGKLIMLQVIIWGIIIGLISGYFGAGGGLSILAVLTMLLGYDLKEAIGTSVIIMTFTALVGATTHIVIEATFWLPLAITSIGALIGANVASRYANKIDEVTLNKVIGVFLICFGIALNLVNYI